MKPRNRLKIIEEIHGGRFILYKCLCKCGNITIIYKGSFNRGTYSCGCLRTELNRKMAKKNIKHNKCDSIEYSSWKQMMSRCNNPKSTLYYRYGGRGIRVCESWKDFRNFYKDMGKRPSKLYSIERINNNGNYEPNNCKWVTIDEQANNRSTCKYFKYNGIRKNITQWAKEFNIKPNTLVYRIKRGKTFQEAINM